MISSFFIIHHIPIMYHIDPNITHSGTHENKLSTLSVPKTKTPRQGRETQMYSSINNARLVGGGIVLDKQLDKVLMISSSKHKDRWILPKGGIEYDERENFAITALRETWEEAGAVCTVAKKLPVIADRRDPKLLQQGKDFPICEFHFYQMKLVELDNDWPESDNRLRRWCTYQEAKHELLKSKRPELLIALNESDIVKDNVTILEYDEHSNILLDTQLDDDADYNV